VNKFPLTYHIIIIHAVPHPPHTVPSRFYSHNNQSAPFFLHRVLAAYGKMIRRVSNEKRTLKPLGPLPNDCLDGYIYMSTTPLDM
jgi:hypothetical protein